MPRIKAITMNGDGDEGSMQARLDLYRMLDEAEADVRAGDRGVSVATIRRRLRR